MTRPYSRIIPTVAGVAPSNWMTGSKSALKKMRSKTAEAALAEAAVA